MDFQSWTLTKRIRASMQSVSDVESGAWKHRSCNTFIVCCSIFWCRFAHRNKQTRRSNQHTSYYDCYQTEGKQTRFDGISNMTRIRLLRLEFVRLWFACFDMGLSTFVGLIWLVFAVVETTEQFNYLSPRTQQLFGT